MGMTISEKILARAAGQQSAEAGDIVVAKVDWAMSHENGGLVSKTFKKIGVPEVWDKDRIVLLLDHRVPANDIKTAEGHKLIREFVKQQGITHFYDMKKGICHQIMPELGHVAPGELIMGTDSHTTTYGAFGAFSSGIGATEMAGVWATGELWLRVPDTFKFNVTGAFSKGVYAKDFILKIIRDIGADGATYKAMEYHGPGMEAMSVSERMTICNMSMEAGAKAGIVPPDAKTEEYLKGRVSRPYAKVYSDDDAKLEKTFDYDLGDLVPQVACPHTVDNGKDVGELAGLEINQAVIGSCTNGRLDDLRIAASILKGNKVHADVRLLVFPASFQIYKDAIAEGIIDTILDAEGIVMNPGCGPCLGAANGIIASGERAIASTNRNFKGRMGSTDGEVYLGSPATVAYSAIKGTISDPREVVL